MMMDQTKDNQDYDEWQTRQFAQWESLCLSCGACCGAAEGDPCEHLKQNVNGVFFCDVYPQRFGEHKTANGRTMRCVPIRDILFKSWPGAGQCGYKKLLFGKLSADLIDKTQPFLDNQ